MNNLILNIKKYDWNVKYDITNKNFDASLFPVDIYKKYLSIIMDLSQRIGDDFFGLADIVLPYTYLTFNRPHIIAGYNDQQIKKIYDDKIIELIDSRKIIYKIFYKNDKKTPILIYKFYDVDSIIYYEIMHYYKILSKNDSVMIISRNMYALDTLLYYQRFVLNHFIADNVTLLIFPNKNADKIENLARDSEINAHMYDEKMADNIPMQDVIIIDVSMYIKELYFAKTNYIFQQLLPIYIMSLQRLKKGGHMIVNLWNVTNKMVFNFILYISTLFESSSIYQSPLINYSVHHDFYVFRNFKGIDQDGLDKLIATNKQNVKYDPTYGQNYEIVNKDEQKLFDIKYKAPATPAKFLNNIIEIDNNLDIYGEYKKHIERVYEHKIKILGDINYIHSNLTEKNINDKLRDNLLFSINYARKIKLEIVEWIDPQKSKQYFYKNLINNVAKYIKQICVQLTVKKPAILPIKLITAADFDNSINKKMENLYYMHELSYAYHIKENYDAYSNIEKFINRNQKRLQDELSEKYNINIGTSRVTRAWVKLYELYIETHFFDNLFAGDKKDISGFHVCEAPGNFVNCTTYLLGKFDKKYVWHAQSLYEGNIFDQYNFIKETRPNWDFGVDNSGDLTKYENILYYIEKYKGVDMLVGDCGIGVSTSFGELHNLANYQLIYGLLIPRIGGNFIIKTLANNINAQFLALLYVAFMKYEKVYIYKASQNFWSSEIYIVGINFYGLNEDETNVILTIGKEIKNTRLYPIDSIPDEFIDMYESVISKIMYNYTSIKQFMVYLIQDKNNLHKFRESIKSIINTINHAWINKYIK